MVRTASKSSSRRGKKSGGGMKDLWDQAKDKAKEDNFDEAVPVDPGNYQMQLVSAEIQDIKERKTLITKWCVLDEDDSGKICVHFQSMETIDNIVWAQRLMIGLGFDIDAIDPDEDSDILQAFNDAIDLGLAAKATVKEKDGYINIYINKAVEVDEEDLFDPKEALGEKKKRGGKKEETSSGRRGRGKKKLTVEDAEAALEKADKKEMKEFIAEHSLDVEVGRKDSEDTVYDAILDAVEAL